MDILLEPQQFVLNQLFVLDGVIQYLNMIGGFVKDIKGRDSNKYQFCTAGNR